MKRALKHGAPQVPQLPRDVVLKAHIEEVRELYVRCGGNLLRVWEELGALEIEVGYSTLTRFVRESEVGKPKKRRTGHYHFEPGEEMQHDTSPHTVTIDGRKRKLQCASVVLCYSRMIYAAVFPRFNRFTCRLFLADAIAYFGGAAGLCMVDNTAVVVVGGSGKNAVFADDLVALAKRYDFAFEAHEVGDANRSARVERPFHYIENNFYPGRTFESLDDVNAQFVTWCDKANARHRRHLGASPRELLAVELPVLRPLPVHIPEIYAVHIRRVSVDGYVSLHTHLYSTPEALIGRQVQVRENRDSVRIFDGHQLVAEHAKRQCVKRTRSTLPEHRYTRRYAHRTKPITEEAVLRAADPVLEQLVTALRKRHGGRAVRPLRLLHRIYVDYPTEAVVAAVRTANDFGLVDLARIERMVLRHVAGDFFRLPLTPEDDDE